MTPFDLAASRERCRRYRLRILELSQKVTALHGAGAFSCLEMVDVVYHALMRRDSDNQYIDSFILSKGHGSLAQYVVLEKLGILPKAELDRFCQAGGILGTHPDIGLPGIEASTGSLGHGLPLALGMALHDKVFNVDRRTFVVQSDGELQEGSVWEALMLAPSWKLNNLVAFVDLNDFQSLGRTSEVLPNFYPIVDKIKAFGWETAEIDGHDPQAVYDAVSRRSGERPMFVIGHTTKGKGVSYMENVPIWHYRSPNPAEYQQAVNELGGN